jgi:hypothetical protein
VTLRIALTETVCDSCSHFSSIPSPSPDTEVEGSEPIAEVDGSAVETQALRARIAAIEFMCVSGATHRLGQPG